MRYLMATYVRTYVHMYICTYVHIFIYAYMYMFISLFRYAHARTMQLHGAFWKVVRTLVVPL